VRALVEAALVHFVGLVLDGSWTFHQRSLWQWTSGV